jgi:hypothetical protein
MNRFSSLVVILVVFALAFTRFQYTKWETPTVTSTLTWDAFGYYMYLPAQFIYHDITGMKWVSDIQEKYHPTGTMYQISVLKNGNSVIKYPIGLALLYWPFFFLGHWVAGWLHYAQDGFSAPYQLAICIAALFYAALGFWALRKVLLHFFSDTIAAITLLMIGLSTNYIQYAAVESGMTHVYLFTMYAFMLLLTIRWHEKPQLLTALGIGLAFGVTTIARPTEAVIMFIPLLWSTQNKVVRQQKWKLLFYTHRTHFFATIVGAFMGIFPQMAYWKIVSGKWVYDVGSKWMFLNPNWQVLFGWEKGWFVYTPVVFFMVAGMFLMQGKVYKRAALTYLLLNVWIVIAWADWRYGASYSSRALVQSYPVLALAFALVVERISISKLKWPAIIFGAYLLIVNLFQIYQYNQTILHYNDNNRAYYAAIYLNPHPDPLDMSLLDTREMIRDTNAFKQTRLMLVDTLVTIHAKDHPKQLLLQQPVNQILNTKPGKTAWLCITAQVKSEYGAFNSHLTTLIQTDEGRKQTNCRLENGICERKAWNTIAYYFKVPAEYNRGLLSIFAETSAEDLIEVRNLKVQVLEEK